MNYHLPLNWRQAKFYLSHRSGVPEYGQPVKMPEFATFMPADQIDDIIPIRDWLYSMGMRYRLLSRHDAATFRGIVVVFDDLADLLRFQQWVNCCGGSG